MSWMALIVAGCFEVVGVMGITMVNRDRSMPSFATLAGGFIVSFLLLSVAMKEISMGTAYAVWTGIGTVGGALVGMFFYGESKSRIRVLFISLIVVSVMGLKLID